MIYVTEQIRQEILQESERCYPNECCGIMFGSLKDNSEKHVESIKSDIIPDGYVEYETEPREYQLNSISTIINVNTAVADVYSSPYDQVKEQLDLAIESLRERQESQLINNDDYGLLKNVPDSQRIQSRTGAPTPDDLD